MRPARPVAPPAGLPPGVGDLLPAFLERDEPARHALWGELGGEPFPGVVGDVRRLARVVPRDGHTLPFKIPFLFTMDGPGTYFGDDLDGLVRIFGGQSRLTRLAWGRILMGGKPAILLCDVALGRTSYVADHDRVERLLHEACAWLRLPVLTPARAYYGWRRRAKRLDSYEVHGVRFFPRHGCYTVVLDRRRILHRGLFSSVAELRDALSPGRAG